MNSWKNRWIQQEKMNQSAEDDEIVDLSTTEEQMIDQPIEVEDFPKSRGVLEGRVRSVRCSCRLMLPSVLTVGRRLSPSSREGLCLRTWLHPLEKERPQSTRRKAA